MNRTTMYWQNMYLIGINCKEDTISQKSPVSQLFSTLASFIVKLSFTRLVNRPFKLYFYISNTRL